RAAAVLDQYATARIMADEYREGILPRAKEAYSLLVDEYGKMLASYPVVLDSQRALYQLHLEYVAALENVWTTGIALEGYLLTDGLEAPARPAEVDRPVRETRSEERRVGKECRSGWSSYHYRKKDLRFARVETLLLFLSLIVTFMGMYGLR